MNKSYKFHQVGDIEKSKDGSVKTVTFENDIYRITKKIETMQHGDMTFDLTSYNVRKKKEIRGISDVYIKSDYHRDGGVEHTVGVSTTSFGGCDLDFVEQYANNLMFAVKSAREIEKMLEVGIL